VPSFTVTVYVTEDAARTWQTSAFSGTKSLVTNPRAESLECKLESSLTVVSMPGLLPMRNLAFAFKD
jgi:hypothetical protein